MANKPFNVWPNMAIALEPDLRWLVERHEQIVNAAGARKMTKARPILVWPVDGKVRIEFVKTYESAASARAYWEPLLDKGLVGAKEAGDA